MLVKRKYYESITGIGLMKMTDFSIPLVTLFLDICKSTHLCLSLHVPVDYRKSIIILKLVQLKFLFRHIAAGACSIATSPYKRNGSNKPQKKILKNDRSRARNINRFCLGFSTTEDK